MNIFTSMLTEKLQVLEVRIISKYYYKVNYEVIYTYKGFEVAGIYQKLDNTEAYCLN